MKILGGKTPAVFSSFSNANLTITGFEPSACTSSPLYGSEKHAAFPPTLQITIAFPTQSSAQCLAQTDGVGIQA